jgi:methylmalonyl-CoA mutase N-terminal domain/subunit
MQKEIALSAYKYQGAIQTGEKIIVGVNKFDVKEAPLGNILTIDDSIRQLQIDKIKVVKASRNNAKVKKVLSELESDAKSGANLMPNILLACEEYATLGEIADVMRGVFGEYKGG